MTTTRIAILVFDNYTALDIIGPYEVLSKIPEVSIYLVATQPRYYLDTRGLKLYADYSLKEMESPEVILIPGGYGIDSILKNQQILEWIKKAHSTSKWTTSVCSGALLLGTAGILSGLRATTHWNRKEQLKKCDVTVVNERYVKDGKVITSAGVTAGIDMALYLAGLLTSDKIAKSIQLNLEYDPKPPFDCGNPKKAPLDILEMFKSKKNRI